MLIDVAGVPLAARVLPRFAASGFTEAVLCVGHLGEVVRDFVGDGARFGLRVRYAEDGPTPRGTWGALRGARDLLAETFVVTYGDSLLPLDLQGPWATLRRSPWATGAMAVWRNRGELEPSNVRFEGGRVLSYRRCDELMTPDGVPDAIDYGATALRRDAVLGLANDEPGERASVEPANGEPAGFGSGSLGTLWADLARRGLLAAHEVGSRFYEIGSPAGLADAEAAIRAGIFDPVFAPGASS